MEWMLCAFYITILGTLSSNAFMDSAVIKGTLIKGVLIIKSHFIRLDTGSYFPRQVIDKAYNHPFNHPLKIHIQTPYCYKLLKEVSHYANA
jgi:hypothetical protein